MGVNLWVGYIAPMWLGIRAMGCCICQHVPVWHMASVCSEEWMLAWSGDWASWFRLTRLGLGLMHAAWAPAWSPPAMPGSEFRPCLCVFQTHADQAAWTQLPGGLEGGRGRRRLQEKGGRPGAGGRSKVEGRGAGGTCYWHGGEAEEHGQRRGIMTTGTLASAQVTYLPYWQLGQEIMTTLNGKVRGAGHLGSGW